MTGTSFESEKERDYALAYLNAPRWRNVKLGLDRMELLMDALGHPERNMHFVHVAGTNGKGSTCAYLASILEETGLRVGLFTSPYIEMFEERIRVNGRMIASHDLFEATQRVREAARAVEEQQGEHPTEFELMCAVALLHFAQSKCDVVVLEVGLGGRFDATNIVHADLCVITPIGLDHTNVLGSTLDQIAYEKAGIVKARNLVVSAPQRAEARAVLERQGEEVDASLVFLDPHEVSAGMVDSTCGHQFFTYQGEEFITSLLGSYQPLNASLAVLAVRMLAQATTLLDLDGSPLEACIHEGIAKALWPGRFEIIGHDPLTIVDGAHNADGARALRESLCALHLDASSRIVFVMGVLADKDFEAMIDEVAEVGSAFITYTPPSPRALGAHELARVIAMRAPDAFVHVASSVDEALRRAAEKAGPEGIIVAFGTLYAIDAVKRANRRLSTL